MVMIVLHVLFIMHCVWKIAAPAVGVACAAFSAVHTCRIYNLCYIAYLIRFEVLNYLKY